MATQVQFRRGTATQHSTFAGANGELTVNTTNKSVHVHDGTTANGFELARADLSNTSGLTLSGLTTVTDLNVSRNLYVSGVSTFVGNVTFQGGTINLGDSNTDNIVFTADVNSNIIPNTDNTYDFGNVSQRWRNANFAGIVTSTSFVGALTGDVSGNSSTATSLQTARSFSVSGDAASATYAFDGTQNVGLAVTLATVNSNVGSYGSSTTIPVVTVNAKGLVTAVSTASVGTALTVAGDTGTATINLLTDTFTVAGGTNVTSTVTGKTATVALKPYISLTGITATGVTTSSVFAGSLQGDVNSTGVSTFASLISTNINASGVTTSTGGFVGALTGNVAGNLVGNVNSSGVSTFASLTSTNINATGISTASQFVSTVATGTAPLVVSSTTLVSNLNAQYLNGNDSTYYTNASNLSSGTVPAARITASGGDFTVGSNLYVNGVLSVGGTSVILNTVELQINDKDITLGITTDALGNDVSNDTTANHGGISVASTTGTPLINIPVDSANNSPSTYKQMMWVKQNHYSGFGTDAWIFNYGISIGNTSTVQNGSRLTVGAGFTVYDTYADVLDIKARNINTSGVTTSSGGFIGNVTGNLVGNVNSIGVSTFASLTSTNINASGVTTSTGGFVGALTGNVTGNLVGNVNSSGVSTFSTINVGATVVVSTSTTTTTTSAISVASISASTYRSAVFQVQVVQGTTYNMTTINVIHDGTETYMTEYGTINQPVGIATFGTDINAGSLRLLAYPTSTSSTTFRVVTTATQI